MALHLLPITPINVVASNGIYTHTFPATTIITYPSIQTIHKPPPPLTFCPSFTTPTPLFQTFFASSSSSSSEPDLESEPELEPEPELESEPELELELELESESGGVDGIEVKIEKVSNNRRRILSKIGIDASLETVWRILTDYERLADIIPSLVVSQVLDKGDNFARLLQIGQQNLAFGLKFSAKGVVDCYEQAFEVLPNGQRRDIEFKMIEGDFTVFEGKWSIEQYEQSDFVSGQQYATTLLYTVEVEPKMWLPVQLVEGRISKEIQMNLFSIREEARKISDSISSG